MVGSVLCMKCNASTRPFARGHGFGGSHYVMLPKSLLAHVGIVPSSLPRINCSVCQEDGGDQTCCLPPWHHPSGGLDLIRFWGDRELFVFLLLFAGHWGCISWTCDLEVAFFFLFMAPTGSIQAELTFSHLENDFPIVYSSN